MRGNTAKIGRLEDASSTVIANETSLLEKDSSGMDQIGCERYQLGITYSLLMLLTSLLNERVVALLVVCTHVV